MTAGDRESRTTEGKPYGRALWDPTTKAQLFAAVKRTTALVKETKGILDRVGSVKSDDTIALYRRLAENRVQVTAEGAGRLMEGVTAQSWHTTRAAVLYKLAEECSRWRGVTDRTLDLSEAIDAAKRARQAVLAYQRVLAMKKPEPEKPRRSKRSTLPLMRWQRMAFDAATKNQRAAVAVMWATGCRPAEIESGVTIRRDGDALVIEIPGAKVTADKGQPIRRIAVDPVSEVGQIIVMMLGTQQEARVQRKAKRIAADFVDIRRRSGLGAISAYSFRHQSASDMKGRGDDPVKIAEALGHASTRTQSRYGSPSKGQKGGPIIGAEAERPVRAARDPRPGKEARMPMPGRNWSI